MKKRFFILLIVPILITSCGRQVPEGTTIKVVNESGVENYDIYTFEDKLKGKLKDFNFTVKQGGTTDYTIRISDYSQSTYTWFESPTDDCSWSTYQLTEESTNLKAELFEYEASKLDGWYFTHTSSEKLKATESGSGCYNYYVSTPFWDELLEGDMDDFARRTARRTSRIVFHQEY